MSKFLGKGGVSSVSGSATKEHGFSFVNVNEYIKGLPDRAHQNIALNIGLVL